MNFLSASINIIWKKKPLVTGSVEFSTDATFSLYQGLWLPEQQSICFIKYYSKDLILEVLYQLNNQFILCWFKLGLHGNLIIMVIQVQILVLLFPPGFLGYEWQVGIHNSVFI